MTNEQEKAKELAKLLTAFADGKQLQYRIHHDLEWRNYLAGLGTRELLEDINGKCDVRIKPETKRIALNQQDLIDRELSNKTMRVDCKYCNRLIVDFDINGVVFLDESVSYEELMSSKFLDNSPCYKEVECE